MAKFLRHEPCPGCGSQDNLARYDDGSAYCFGCEHHEKAEGASPERPVRLNNEGKRMSLLQGSARAIPARRLTEETCQKFRYWVGENSKGETVQIANYVRGGQTIAQKVRTKDKKFTVIGEGKGLPLFGQNLWSKGKRIVVTEGEIDAMSISQAFGNKWPVVSLPQGAQSAAKVFAQEIEYLEQFGEVVIAFDMDEPGQRAAQEAAAVLSPGKAKIASLPEKDASDCLKAGKARELLVSIWEAKPWRPDGVVDVASLAEAAAAPITMGKPWPWAGLNKTYGRRRCELYGLGAGTGCGKSTVFKQIALHIMETEDLPVGILALEEPPKHTLRTLAGMRMRKRIHVPGVAYKQEDLDDALKWLDGKVYFYDHFGAATFETIKEKIRYMVRALGVKDIFLDHLTALAASIDTDERKAIDKLMAELSSLTQELDCTIYFVSHLSTPDGKPHEEGGRVLEKHFRGSRAIGYWSHFLFGVERDKQDVEGVLTFRILKDRYTGDSAGVTFGLRYDKDSGLLVECPLPAAEPEGRRFFPKPGGGNDDY